MINFNNCHKVPISVLSTTKYIKTKQNNNNNENQKQYNNEHNRNTKRKKQILKKKRNGNRTIKNPQKTPTK